MDHSSTLRELFQQAEEQTASPGPPPKAPVANEETLSVDDKDRLEELFGRPRPMPSTARSDRSDRDGPWPTHNYNEAYHQITRQRPRPRRRQSVDESTLWEIHELLDEDQRRPSHEAPPVAAAAPTPWPDHKGLDLSLMEHPPQDGPSDLNTAGPRDPVKWLEALTDEPPLPTATEARLIGTLRGDTDILRRPLFDTTETLHATDPVWRRTTTTGSRPERKRNLLARPRALFLKVAGVALGLKVGLSAGYLVATLL